MRLGGRRFLVKEGWKIRGHRVGDVSAMPATGGCSRGWFLVEYGRQHGHHDAPLLPLYARGMPQPKRDVRGLGLSWMTPNARSRMRAGRVNVKRAQ